MVVIAAIPLPQNKTHTLLDEAIPSPLVPVGEHFEWGCLHVHIHIQDGLQNPFAHRSMFEK